MATIVCPNCSFAKTELMAEDSCLIFYQCLNCHEVLKPNSPDCCVFCSFSDSKCPPRMAENN